MNVSEITNVKEFIKTLNSTVKQNSNIRELHVELKHKKENDTINQDNDNSIYNTLLTDIDVEIIEMSPERELPETNRKIETTDYKSRFKLAKAFFQSLEELRPTPEKNPIKLNECEQLLQYHEQESRKENNKKHKKKVKAHSLPSSEFSKIWHEYQENEAKKGDDEDGKFVKISEKFNVDGLFNDVVSEGRLSRQGSFRGIPHKKAVLETFKSMENLSDNTLSPYEIATEQLNDFAKENNIKNAQTYLTEYPYLPRTDPSKYHSRFDAKACGLISRSELLKSKPRRNSVPDLRLNAKFIVNL